VAGYGGRLERIPYRDDRNDLEALAEAVRRTGARLVYLANPDNPSGSGHSAEGLRALLASPARDSLLPPGQAHIGFAPQDAVPPIDADDPRVIRLRTFSKAHGMAGARIGYAIATPETIAVFEKIRLHFGVNLAAQAGALASLGDTDYLQSIVMEVAN